MQKLDLKKQFRHLYTASAKAVSVVEVPAFQFAMVDGVIPVGTAVADSDSFQQALEALYGIAYTLKFRSKLRKKDPIDYTVMALEGLWWAETSEFDITAKVPMFFTAMIMQPDHLTEADFQAGLEELRRKRPGPALEKLRFERFQEGRSIQILHIGPYSDEPRSLTLMQAYIDEHGFRYRGRHHEIYLGDPRRAAPEKLKTVLRHPVEKV